MKRLFMSLVRELYFARKYLNEQTGQRKDPDAADYIQHTWNDFCEEVGMSRQTANRWLKGFVPAEEAEDGLDHYTGKLPALLLVSENLKRFRTRGAG